VARVDLLLALRAGVQQFATPRAELMLELFEEDERVGRQHLFGAWRRIRFDLHA
jgi:hypothetical protein